MKMVCGRCDAKGDVGVSTWTPAGISAAAMDMVICSAAVLLLQKLIKNLNIGVFDTLQ